MPMIKAEEQSVVEVFKGVFRRTLACGKDLLISRFEYEEGSKVPPHKHSYEQVTTILEGKQKVTIKNGDTVEEIVITKGDSYIVPAGFEHKQLSLQKTVTIDVWCLAP